jgi:hypothetical protein
MKNTLILCSLALLLASCEDKPAKEVTVQKETAIENKDTVVAKSLPEKDEVSTKSEMECEPNAEEQKNIVDILFPFWYRIFDGEDLDPSQKINRDWISLYKDSSENYYIKQADYYIEDGYSECAEVGTKDLKSKDNVILFIDLPNVNKGKVSNVDIPKARIWPNDTVNFEFNGVRYSLHATGKIIDGWQRDGDEFYVVRDYKLYISTDEKPEELLLDIKSFEDSFVQLIFIGDIDGDGIPDFVFDTAIHYEEKSKTLFLSTKADDGKITKQVAKLGVSFDC